MLYPYTHFPSHLHRQVAFTTSDPPNPIMKTTPMATKKVTYDPFLQLVFLHRPRVSIHIRRHESHNPLNSSTLRRTAQLSSAITAIRFVIPSWKLDPLILGYLWSILMIVPTNSSLEISPCPACLTNPCNSSTKLCMGAALAASRTLLRPSALLNNTVSGGLLLSAFLLRGI